MRPLNHMLKSMKRQHERAEPKSLQTCGIVIRILFGVRFRSSFFHCLFFVFVFASHTFYSFIYDPHYPLCVCLCVSIFASPLLNRLDSSLPNGTHEKNKNWPPQQQQPRQHIKCNSLIWRRPITAYDQQILFDFVFLSFLLVF